MSKELEALELWVNKGLMIKQAIERSEPMKVIRVKNDSVMGYADKCPNCDIHFHFINEFINYCHECGQKLDWSAEDE